MSENWSRPTRACELKFFQATGYEYDFASRPTRACELKCPIDVHCNGIKASRPTRACELKYCGLGTESALSHVTPYTGV